MAQEAMPEIELLRETEAPLFVINLCASTTPLALAHPDNPELKRFTFFVTRRREEGRERFRLHMGYFSKLDDAERLLAIVRDIYPAAWAGPAPGNKAPSARVAAATALPPPAVAPAPTIVSAPVALSAPSPAAPLALPAPLPAASAPPAPSVTASPPPVDLNSMSNVREVLAELGDEPKAKTVERSAPPQNVPELKLESTGRHVTPSAAAAPAAASAPSLSDSQVLRMLETRRAPPVGQAGVVPVPNNTDAETSIRMLTPEDTQTLRDIKLDVQSNAAVSFAVQLQWSVQPIDMAALPQLAIFDAYTLYTVEGNRQGRRWYGLRLGFFTDAMSAKQVAYYVRSDFTAVAVVPVTMKERDRATGKGDLSATGTFVAPVAARKAPVKADAELPGLKLLDNDRSPPKRDLDDAPSAKIAAQGKATAAKPSGKRPAQRGRAARGQNNGAPQTLEQTLEVLGASTLSIDTSSTIIDDSAVRSVGGKKKSSRFSRLLERLSERM